MANPRIKLKHTRVDHLVDMIGWIAILTIWVLVISNYSKLPDTIPIHYNGLGIPDGFGGKSHIWLLLIVATVLFVGMTILNRFPHIFCYPVKITKDNAERQYVIATQVIRYVKLIVVVIFGFIVCKTILYIP